MATQQQTCFTSPHFQNEHEQNQTIEESRTSQKHFCTLNWELQLKAVHRESGGVYTIDIVANLWHLFNPLKDIIMQNATQNTLLVGDGVV